MQAPSGPPPSPSPPRAPRAAQRRPPRPCPRRASLPPPSPAGWLARSPPPRPGALESAEFAEREPFKFSALGCLERGLSARKKDGGEREEEAPGRPRAPGARHPRPALPARPAPARGGRRANLFGQKPVLGRVCLSQSSGSCLFCRESRCFCSLRGGEEIRGWPRVFFELTLESVRRGLVVINMTERVRRLIGVWLRIGPRGQAPGASTSPGWGRLVENSRLLDFNFIIFFPRLHQGQGGRGEAATISSVSAPPPRELAFYLKTPNWAGP